MSPAASTKPIRALAVVGDGSAYFTAPEDGTIRMYETDTRTKKWLGNHPGARSLALTTVDGRQMLLSGGKDGRVLRWEFDGDIPSSTSDEVEELRTGGTVETIAVGAATVAVTSDTGMVRFLELTKKFSGEAGHDGVRCVDVSTNGKRVVSGSSDGTIIVWQCARGRLTKTHTHALPADLNGARSLLIVDQSTVVVGTNSGAMVRWDWSADEALCFADEHTEPVLTLSRLSNGAADAIISGGGDNAVRKWSIRNGKQIGEPVLRLNDAVYATAVAAKGPHQLLFAACADGKVHIHDGIDGWQSPFVGHTGAVQAIAISDDDRDLVVTGSADKTARVWTEDGQLGHALTGHRREVTAVALSPVDTSRIITGSADGTAIIWDRYQRSPIHTLDHGAPVWAVAVTPDGERVITGGSGGSIKIWNAARGTAIGPAKRVERFAVSAIAIAGDGSVAVIGGDSGEIAIWDLPKMQKRGDSISAVGRVTSVSITMDGGLAAVGGADGIVSFWDIGSRRRQSHLDTGHGSVTKVLLTRDGEEVITCGADGTIKRWRRDTGAYVGWHHCDFTDAVMAIALSRDGDLVIAGGSRGQIRRVSTEDFHVVQEQIADDLRSDTRLPPLPRLSSDNPSRVDLIDNTRDVRVLSELIVARNNNDSDSLSIALLGEWGSGKSSMIHQVIRLVYELVSANRPQSPHDPFVRHVRQVRFNAWHYSDDQLWTGLVEQLFHSINADPTVADRDILDTTSQEDEKLRKREEEQARLRLRLRHDTLVTRHETLEKTLRVASAPTSTLPVLTEVRRARHLGSALVNAITTYRYARRQADATNPADDSKPLVRHLNGYRRRLVYLFVIPALFLVAFIAQRIWLPEALTWLWSWICAGGGVLAVVTSWVTLGRSRLERANNAIDEALCGEMVRLQTELAESKQELSTVDPAFRLDQLLRKLHEPERYQRFRGVTGYVYQDLTELNEALRSVAEQAEHSVLERIVLYIDDLDRCSPDRIMAVVQAVNLLTTFSMFAVVVPMDLVGLRRMLPSHQDASARPSPLLSLELLEKVFHVAYAIRPLGQRGRSLVGHLFKDVRRDSAVLAEQADPEAEPSNAPAPDASPTPGDSNGQPVSPATATPTAARTLAHLSADGRALAITDDEVALLGFLGTRLRSPRAVKKLTNLYRMVLVSEHDRRHEFLAGEWQAVAILLTGLVSCPGTFGELIGVLSNTTATCDHDRNQHHGVLNALVPAREASGKITELIEALREHTDGSPHECLSTYRCWAIKVARYGFETYTKYTG